MQQCFFFFKCEQAVLWFVPSDIYVEDEYFNTGSAGKVDGILVTDWTRTLPR